MGKVSSDKQLALFVLVVYELIVFQKALRYLSVELVDFLFQIEKGTYKGISGKRMASQSID
ncbi:hypothetical protein Gotur_029977 [Gossypium turneri]